MKRLLCLCACSSVLVALLPACSCASARGRSSYHIDAEYFPEERKLSARMETEIVNNTENAFSELKFRLFANAYREGAAHPPVSEVYRDAAYYNGESYGGIEVTSCEGGDISLSGEDEEFLTVALGEELYPDETARLVFTFEVTLAEANHRLGAGEHAVNLANFYPVLCPYGESGFLEHLYTPEGDPFVSECADYDVCLRVPDGYEVMGAERGEDRYVLHAENVRDVAFVIGQGYSLAERDVGGVKVRYYFLEGDETALDCAAESLAFFSEKFLSYPYPAYTVVQTDLPYGGMEYPALAMISLSLRPEEIPAVVAHETAHQWWYAAVGSDQYGEAWQDEGLAEYSVALLAEENGKFGSYGELVAASERAYRAFFSVRSQVTGSADTRMSRPLTEYSGLYEYRSIAYDKGVILFDRIRSVAGKKRMMRALSRYAETYCGKMASKADLVSCFEEEGARVGELIASFTEGKCVI